MPPDHTLAPPEPASLAPRPPGRARVLGAVALLLVSALIVFLVLRGMAASGAAATGGCGGG